jgi:hypothetical protein
MIYFAVQTRSIEPDIAVVEILVRTAHVLGMRFTKIEALDRFKLGTTEFMRFRMKEDATKLLDKLHEMGRSVIGSTPSGFTARLKDRTGSASTTLMLAAPQRSMVFRGPGAQFWERQFEAAN